MAFGSTMKAPLSVINRLPRYISEPWSFISNETKVLVGTVECTILELTSTTLKLQYTFDDAGVTYTEVDTYRH